MGLRITLDDEAAQIVLDDLIRRSVDLSPLMADLSEEMLGFNVDRFDQQVNPQGLPWEPLNPVYAARKAKEGRPNKILQSRGFLLSGIRSEFGSTFAAVVSDQQTSQLHQEGTSRMPRREFLGLSNPEEDTLQAISESYFIPDAIRNRGRAA